MGTSDLRIARAVGECNLRTFKTSRVTINHEMHEQAHTIFHSLYSQQNYSNALLCTRYVLLKTLQWFPMCSHVLFEPIRNIMLWQASSMKFLKDFEKLQKISRKLNFQLLKAAKVRILQSQSTSVFLVIYRLWWAALALNHVTCLTVVKVVHGG